MFARKIGDLKSEEFLRVLEKFATRFSQLKLISENTCTEQLIL